MLNFLAVIFFIFGLIFGSFINALVYRLKNNISIISFKRSICPKCHNQLKWYHNIPLISFVFLKGKCAFCKKPIAFEYLLVEFVTGLLFAITFLLTLNMVPPVPTNFAFLSLQLIFNLSAVFFLIIIFIYDLKYYLILDQVSITAIVCFLLLQFVILGLQNNFEIISLIKQYSMLIFSAIIGGGWFLWQFVVSRGRWVGDGDIRLGVLMGLLLGWPAVLLALVLAYVGGAVFSMPLLIFKKKNLKSEIPFGVFLAPATIISIFYSEQIINWYFNLLI